MITVRPSELKDVYELFPKLRQKDKEELEAIGYKPRSAVYFSFKHGIYRQTAFVNGKIAAMWGVCGAPLGMVGQPYLLTTPQIEKASVKEVVKIYKREVGVMLQIFPILTNYVDYNYQEAVKLLHLSGFTIEEPIALGPKRNLFCRYSKTSGEY